MSTPLQNIAKPNTSPSTWSLSEPLLCYHGRIVRTFHALPKEGAVVELIQRIVLIALIPFVYPLLGLLALIGRVTQHPSTEKGRQDPISPVPKDPVTDIERKQTLFKDLENVLSSYLTDILRAKLFIRAESGETHFVRSFTFNESLTSPVLASNLLEAVLKLK